MPARLSAPRCFGPAPRERCARPSHKSPGPGRGLVALGALAFCVPLLSSCSVLADAKRDGGNTDEGFFEVEHRNVVSGAKLDLSLKDWEYVLPDARTEIRDITLDTGSHISIEERWADGLTILGTRVGSTAFSFEAKNDGQWESDSFDIETVEPTTFRMSDCGGFFVRGETGLVSYEFNPGERYAGNEPAFGYGLHPVDLDAEGAAELSSHGVSVTAFALELTEEAPDSLTLTSTLEGDDSALTIATIDRTGLTVEAGRASSAYVGRSVEVELQLLHDGKKVCSLPRLELQPRDPTVCKVLGAPKATGAGEAELRLELLAEGLCQLSVRLGGLATELATDIEVRISAEPPSTGGDWSDWD